LSKFSYEWGNILNKLDFIKFNKATSVWIGY